MVHGDILNFNAVQPTDCLDQDSAQDATLIEDQGQMRRYTCPYDFIVSNPPYIPTDQLSKLEPEVRAYEDSLALDGGPDGLELIRSFIRRTACERWIKPGGYMWLETDISHQGLLNDWIQATCKLYFIALPPISLCTDDQ